MSFEFFSVSKTILFLLATVLILQGCATSKKPTKVLRPVRTNSTTNAPKAGPNHVDTVEWTVLSVEEYPPITRDEKAFVNPFDNVINTVSFLIPFNSSQNMESLTRGEKKFARYYAGVLMAIEKLEREGRQFEFKVYDTKRSENKVEELINSGKLNNSDVIIGPYEIENLKRVALWAKQNQIPVLSPWRSSSKVAEDNLYYYQVRPLIEQYFEVILTHAIQQNKIENIYILRRDGGEDDSKIRSFHIIHEILNQGVLSPGLKEFTINLDSLHDSDLLIFDQFISKTDRTALILPNYSSRDNRYVYSVIRKINAELNGQNISIYGMPTLINPERLDLEFFRSLNLLTADYKFLEKQNSNYKIFVEDYFSKYSSLPNEDSYDGYDTVILLANLIEKSKRGRVFSEISHQLPYLSLSAEFKKFHKEGGNHSILSAYAPGDFLVNSNLFIIGYRENHFEKIDLLDGID